MQEHQSLTQYNEQLLEQITATKVAVEAKRLQYGYTPKNAYVFSEVTTHIQAVINIFLADAYPEITPVPCLIHWIDKAVFGADLTIKFDTHLIRTLGKSFASEFVPQVVKLLEKNKKAVHLVQVEQKGIYINCTLEDTVRAKIGEQILSLGDRYGDIDSYAGRTAIAEYSSPNAAKHLHAGHVRSTVIGYVLSNIYEHAGYTVHRINHINDRGGFGQLIEGWKRWHNLLYAKGLRNNDLNYAIYTIWRKAELLNFKTPIYDREKDGIIELPLEDQVNYLKNLFELQDKDSFYQELQDQINYLKNFFDMESKNSFIQDFNNFKNCANRNFNILEVGNLRKDEEDSEVFNIRKEILASSLVEFKEFYDKLNISHDYTIGESFYEKIGRQTIEEGEKKGLIIKFTQEVYEQYLKNFKKEENTFTSTEQEQKKGEMINDIGSYVVLLDNRERFVVLRSDGGSIYATRDLGCLWFRTQTRAPSLISYEVGQEQADHFQKLFETADKLGRLDRNDGTKTKCIHIAHGFYVDATTKKKLSSRAGAANVHHLIDATIAYFKDKYTHSTEFTPKEIAHNAHTLGIASIIINDLSKNRMDPVLVDPDLNKTIQGFEQSGGAYLIYTVCRAKSLLRKATVSFASSFASLQQTERTTPQIGLLQQLSELPAVLEKSVMQHEPSLLVNYVYQLTQSFNTMYGSTDRMIDDALALKLTACYIQVMTNVLRICNIEPLERM